MKDEILDKILFPKKDVYVDSLWMCGVQGKDAEILWKYRKPRIIDEQDRFYIDRFCNVGLMSYKPRFDFKNKKVTEIARATPMGLSLLREY